MAERPPACAEWQDDLAGWLAAQIGPEREARLEAHLASCAVCRAEADSLLAVSATLLATEPGPAGSGDEPAPVELGVRIAAALAAQRRARRLGRAGLVALAGGAAAVVLALVLVLPGGGGPAPLEGRPVAFTVLPDGARAEAVVADGGGDTVVHLTATGLDPGVTYALWLSSPGGRWEDRTPAGTFRPDEHGTVDARLRCALPVADYGRLWATTPDGQIALDTA